MRGVVVGTDGDEGAEPGGDWHPGRVWLSEGGSTWAGCGWGDSWDQALAGGSLLVGSAMSQEASRVGGILRGVDLGGWQGGAARAASVRLQQTWAHATMSQALLWQAEEAMRQQGSALGALLLASAGVP